MDVVITQQGNVSNWKLIVRLASITDDCLQGLIDATNYVDAISSKFFVGQQRDLRVVPYLPAGGDTPSETDLKLLIEFLPTRVPWVPDGCTGPAATVWLGRSRHAGSWCTAVL